MFGIPVALGPARLPVHVPRHRGSSRHHAARAWIVGVWATGLSTLAAPAAAQLLPPSPTGFNIIPYEEKWEDPAAAGIAAPLKRIALDPDGAILLDLGGTLRERGEARRNSVFALPEADGLRRDAYLLHRLLFHANFRVGEHFRAFVELENAGQTGRSPAALPTDRNRGDLCSGLIEATRR